LCHSCSPTVERAPTSRRRRYLLEEARKQAVEINQPSAAVSAIVAKGKLAGLVVDRKEVGKPGEFEGMNVDELREHIAREAAALGIGMPDAGEEGEGGVTGGPLN